MNPSPTFAPVSCPQSRRPMSRCSVAKCPQGFLGRALSLFIVLSAACLYFSGCSGSATLTEPVQSGLSISPTSIDFGTVITNTSLSLDLVITNLTKRAALISGLSVTCCPHVELCLRAVPLKIPHKRRHFPSQLASLLRLRFQIHTRLRFPSKAAVRLIPGV